MANGEENGGEELSLEFTPTWVVAVVCFIIIAISLFVERCLHYGGKYLKRKDQKPLFEALQKVKEELMLLGFISLLLTVLQGAISKMCIPEKFVRHMLPCSLKDKEESTGLSTTEHIGGFRRLLSEAAGSQAAYCAKKNKVPFLSIEGLHHLHIFIFVLAVVHCSFSVLTVVFGGARIHQWKHWEDAIAKENYDTDQALKPAVTHVHDHAFIRDHFVGVGEKSSILRWMHSFIKQFYGAVTKADYLTIRLGFITTHCKGNRKFNFHKYMIRALEDDFKVVVGISWYLWVFVIIFLLLNIDGWHTYFWIAFIPFVLLLAVGTKLEHVITKLAHEVAEKHIAIEGDLVVKPSDEHFWFNRPQITLFLIHFILFQNAFEIAYFFWIWVQYGFDSCIMGEVRYIIPRLIIGAIIQVLCSYSTLPLYAIVTQMGSNFKKAIFDEHVQAGILGWREKVKKKKALRGAFSSKAVGRSTEGSSSVNGSAIVGTSSEGATTRIQMANLVQKENEGNEIQPSNT
ncbi:MLO-like protein 1 [Amaranthus tricolor]|uniref:MLO-like protein 1 n=1 Tax=Amaranthus tricolor TaxID=29722 RepID=UPI00259108E8|nr:MLO-like protein 1 [Amaranthus tricolor]